MSFLLLEGVAQVSANGVISYKVCLYLLLIANFTTSYLWKKMCVHPIIACSELFCPSGMFSRVGKTGTELEKEPANNDLLTQPQQYVWGGATQVRGGY